MNVLHKKQNKNKTKKNKKKKNKLREAFKFDAMHQ